MQHTISLLYLKCYHMRPPCDIHFPLMLYVATHYELLTELGVVWTQRWAWALIPYPSLPRSLILLVILMDIKHHESRITDANTEVTVTLPALHRPINFNIITMCVCTLSLTHKFMQSFHTVTHIIWQWHTAADTQKLTATHSEADTHWHSDTQKLTQKCDPPCPNQDVQEPHSRYRRQHCPGQTTAPPHAWHALSLAEHYVCVAAPGL